MDIEFIIPNSLEEIPEFLLDLPVFSDIETDAVSHMLEFYGKNKKKMGVALKQFDILARLKEKELLKPAVFFYRWKDDFSKDFVRYRKDSFDSFVRMLEEHL